MAAVHLKVLPKPVHRWRLVPSAADATDITQPGWHSWQTNYAADPNGAGLAVDWQGALWAETRVP